MNFVHVEDFFHPEAGYQLNILAPLQVKQGHTVTIVTAELDKVPSFLTSFFTKESIEEKDSEFIAATGVNIIRIPLYCFVSGRAIFKPMIFSVVRAQCPDVVFIHGEDTFTGMSFLLLNRFLPYPLVYDCHMVEMASQNRFRKQFRWIYRKIFTPIFLNKKIPLIRVVDSDYVEKCLGIPLSHTELLSFGTDTSYFRFSQERRQQCRDRLGIAKESFLILYAGKLDETKGGQFLADALSEPLAYTGRQLEFLIVGNADGKYGAEVERTLKAGKNIVHRLPTQKYRDLLDIYCAADLAVFPKQCSMSFFEVQACALPVLFERNEINEQRSEAGSAFLFSPNSIEDLRVKLEQLASTSAVEYGEYREAARRYIVEHYDYVPIAQSFSQIMIDAAERRARAHTG